MAQYFAGNLIPLAGRLGDDLGCQLFEVAFAAVPQIGGVLGLRFLVLDEPLTHFVAGRQSSRQRHEGA